MRKLIDTFGMGSRVPILKLKEQEDEDLKAVAEYVYEHIFLRYTMKQWGQTPEEIDPEVTGRVPVLISGEILCHRIIYYCFFLIAVYRIIFLYKTQGTIWQSPITAAK